MISANELIEKYKLFFNNNISDLWGSAETRKTAFDKFLYSGFPTPKNEEWRFTNLNFLNSNDFIPSLKEEISGLPASSEELGLNYTEYMNTLVIVNGFYSENLSRIDCKHSMIDIMTLSRASIKYTDIFDEHYGKILHFSGAFSNLNTAFAADGVFIKIRKDNNCEQPIHIIYINDARQKPLVSFPRNFIVAEANSGIKIVETFITRGENPSFFNAANEIVLSEYSNIDICRVYEDSSKSYIIAGSSVLQHENSLFNSTTLTIGGKFVRNNIDATLLGEGSSVNYYGLYLAEGDNFIDNHTSVDHEVPGCTSSELYKGILDDKAHAVFNGKIIVRRNAQKTQAYQSNKNILLTNNAKINTKPQLEIFADDVKCSHGATAGYLDREAMFYLKSRGLGEERAKALLLNAFAAEVIEKIAVPETRNHIKILIDKYLNIGDLYFCYFPDSLKDSLSSDF